MSFRRSHIEGNRFPKFRVMDATLSGLKSRGGAVNPGFGNPGLEAAIPLGLTSIDFFGRR